MKISVVGLGYVSLPLAIQFARAKVPILGIDIESVKKCDQPGRSYIRHVVPEQFEQVREATLRLD
jgi:UDP-N-acetyl-D-mannosaminuronate dehydrogenase